MVPGLFERPLLLWGVLVASLLVLAVGPPAYLRRYVPEATPGLVAGSYVATLVSLAAVPLLPLQYLAVTGGFQSESWLTVVAGYLLALLVATALYAGILWWRADGVLTGHRRVVAVATLPATNLLFLGLAPGLFVLAVVVGRIP